MALFNELIYSLMHLNKSDLIIIWWEIIIKYYLLLSKINIIINNELNYYEKNQYNN